MIPAPWEFALLALAAWRLWLLIAEDTITEPARRRFVTGHRWREDLIECPYCLGAWISFAWVAAFWLWPHGTLVAAVPLAVSAAVGVVATAVHTLAGE
jgi:hypothetical protein